jgi:ATP-dependent Clp protease ATP-binding subunit ClpA
LKRALQKNVESPLSVSLLAGEFGEGDVIEVGVDEAENKLVFRQAGEAVKAEKLDTVDANID